MGFLSLLSQERMDTLSSSEPEMGPVWFKIHILRPSLYATKTDGQPQATNLRIFYRALIRQHTPTVYALSAPTSES